MESDKAYYLAEFKKIEEGKLSWNWCSCLFLPYWLCYRKMYAGFLKMIFLGIIAWILSFFTMHISSESVWISISVFFLVFMGCGGLLGNRRYYSTIKHRIKEGYHLCKDYSPTSAVWLSIFILCPLVNRFVLVFCGGSAFGVLAYFLSSILQIVTPFICYYMDDKKVTDLVRNNSDFSNEMNEENILRLL